MIGMVVCLAAVGCMVLSGGCGRKEGGRPRRQAGVQGAEIVRAFGTVRARTNGEWADVTETETLVGGALAGTAEGEMLLEWAGACRVRVGPGSMVRILRTRLGATAEDSEGGLKLLWGHVLTQCEGEEAGMRFVVETGLGRGETLGGDLGVDVLDRTMVRYFAVRGTARVRAGEREVELGKGTYAEVLGEGDAEEHVMTAGIRKRFGDEGGRMRRMEREDFAESEFQAQVDMGEAFRLWEEAGFGSALHEEETGMTGGRSTETLKLPEE